MITDTKHTPVFNARQRIDDLRHKYPNVRLHLLDGDLSFIEIPDMAVPGFNKQTFRVGFKLPDGFPFAPLAYFYIDPELARDHGGSIHGVWPRREVIVGQDWEMVSVRSDGWSTDRNTIYTYAMFVRGCLAYLSRR